MHLAYIWIVSHLSAKNYRNLWKFDEVLTKTNLLSFLGHGVYLFVSDTKSWNYRYYLIHLMVHCSFVEIRFKLNIFASIVHHGREIDFKLPTMSPRFDDALHAAEMLGGDAAPTS